MTDTTHLMTDTTQVVTKKDVNTLDKIHTMRQEISGSLIKVDGCLSRIVDGQQPRKPATEARGYLLSIRKQVNDLRDELFELYKHDIKPAGERKRADPPPEVKTEVKTEAKVEPPVIDIASPLKVQPKSKSLKQPKKKITTLV